MRALAVALGTLLLSSPAMAQQENPPIPEPHIPDAPQRPRDERTAKPETPRIDKADYPTQLVLRPVTLAEAQAEIGLALTFVNNDGNGLFWPTLRAAFGVTRDVELGFTWAAFLSRFSPATAENGIETGKAFSIDGGLTLVPDWFAVRVRLAFYADPDVFGFGLVLGAPFRWRILPASPCSSARTSSTSSSPSSRSTRTTRPATSPRSPTSTARSPPPRGASTSRSAARSRPPTRPRSTPPSPWAGRTSASPTSPTRCSSG